MNYRGNRIKIIFVFIGLLFLFGNITINSQTKGEVYKCYYPKTINVDGDLSDWDKTLFEKVVNHKNYSKQYFGEDDISYKFACVADNTNLYVAVKITDDVKMTDQNTGINLFRDDSFSLFFDAKNNESSGYDDDDSHIIIGRDGTNHNYHGKPLFNPNAPDGNGITGITDKITYKVKDTPTGWLAEVAIPLETVKISYSDGTLAGFNIVVHDDDNDGIDNANEEGTRDNYIPWSNKDRFGHHTFISQCLPMLFGDIKFIEEKPGLRMKCPYAVRIVLDGKFDDWSDNWDHVGHERGSCRLFSKMPESDKDLSFDFQVASNREMIYFAVKIKDDIRVAGEDIGSATWKDDCLDIFLDTDHNGGIDFDRNDVHIRIARDGTIGGGPKGPQEAFGRRISGHESLTRYKIVETHEGWNVELAIPTHIPGIFVSEENSVGVNIVVTDDDSERNTTMYDHYLSWSQKDAHHNWWTHLSNFLPMLYGDMFFVEVEPKN